MRCLGILPHGSHPTEPQVGDRIISLGGRVGRDGIHGATFSSAGMDASTVDHVGSAVQIGDPITEKGLIEVIERARDAKLYNAITDCGAGGFSSSVGEMGEDLGVEVDLSVVRSSTPVCSRGRSGLARPRAHRHRGAARQARSASVALRRMGR